MTNQEDYKMSKKRKEKVSEEPSQQKPLRLWPGVVLVIIQWLVRFVVLAIMPMALGVGILGGLVGGIAVFVWWAFFSRAPRMERWGGIFLIIAAMITTWLIQHESMGPFMFIGYVIPVLSLVLVIWAGACRGLAKALRRGTLIALLLLTCMGWALLRTEGISGSHVATFAWRWTQSSEERLLAQTRDEPMAQPSTPAVEKEAHWPGFRGPHRDGIIHNVQIKTDWSASPPRELWRRPVGPGWSSFAVHGGLLYTQEQRGDDEVVSCYNMTTGKPVWIHRDTARFFEANGGAGPRGTPTLNDGRVYTLGATGILNVLDAGNGNVVWSRNAGTDADTKVPIWGFSSSPLVVEDLVIVALANALIAYDLATGEPRWSFPGGGDCYSSPHLLHIDGVPQILLQNGKGTISVTPADGTLLWEHSWEGVPIVQPMMTSDGDILISADEKTGVRRISVTLGSDGWTVEERWTSGRLKPYFNDSVIHNGHAYGFDGPLLACIDIKDGSRKWRGGRYGRGQFVLLADQDLLLVLTEKGGLALAKAVPDRFTELAQFPAIEGKTWNHPVLVGDVLLVRNGREMAAFRLSLAGI
jgi:outer membrane protein assembly factor BamB